MKRISIIVLIVCFLVLSNCATILNGYHKDVSIENAPKDLKVMTKDGVDIPVKRTFIKYNKFKKPFSSEMIEKEIVKISLRAKSEQVLILKYDNKEVPILVEGKISPLIMFLDGITGLYPAFIDAQTGSWYYYDNIEFFVEEAK